MKYLIIALFLLGCSNDNKEAYKFINERPRPIVVKPAGLGNVFVSGLSYTMIDSTGYTVYFSNVDGSFPDTLR